MDVAASVEIVCCHNNCIIIGYNHTATCNVAILSIFRYVRILGNKCTFSNLCKELKNQCQVLCATIAGSAAKSKNALLIVVQFVNLFPFESTKLIFSYVFFSTEICVGQKTFLSS